jgi:hypothetical protein
MNVVVHSIRVGIDVEQSGLAAVILDTSRQKLMFSLSGLIGDHLYRIAASFQS